MRLATRLFVASSALVAATAAVLAIAADRLLRERLETEVAAGLEHEARLVAALLSPDPSRWPDEARRLGELIGRRVTLVDPTGVVRGDTEFERAALLRLENHAARPEVRDALAQGAGRDRRLSASTNERQLYVAVRSGPPGLAAVRVSASLAAVDAEVRTIQRAILSIGVVALLAAAALAWFASRALARSLVELGAAARDIAAGRPPAFPESRIPEVADHILALRAMHHELATRIAELRREREETGALVDALADGILGADARGRIVSCNAAARRLLGYEEGSALPPLSELFHEKHARDLVREIVSGGHVEQRELELAGRSAVATGHQLPDGSVLIVLRDVTALRRLEAVRRDFVANVSHELKTPLTSIAGYAETLASEVSDPQARGFAETIVTNARRMERLVEDLLDLARIESGGWQPNRTIVELEAAAGEAWSSFAQQAAQAGVRFELALAPDARRVPVDPEALRQILTNLFDNALRHTTAGGRIRLESELSREGVTLSVADTGSGIPSEHLPRIFERFYRADAGRSRALGGTGLGLAIVKHFVESHGGRVWAESELGAGTVIRMTLPAGGPPP